MFQGMNIKDWITAFTSLVALMVVPLTLLGLWRSRIISQEAENWKSRQEEIGTYNEINIRYIELLRFMMQNTDVDIGEFRNPKPAVTEEETYKRKLMYATLVALMERAYLLYQEIKKYDKKMTEYRLNQTILVKFIDFIEARLFGSPPPKYESHILETQWPGWEKYFENYCRQKDFQNYWITCLESESSGTITQWHDSDFEKYINDLIEKNSLQAHESLHEEKSPVSPML